MSVPKEETILMNPFLKVKPIDTSHSMIFIDDYSFTFYLMV
jgi:hypothetical protein